MEADLESYSVVIHWGHFLLLLWKKEDVLKGGAKSPEGREKNQGEESACKMAAKIPVSSSVPRGIVFPHSLGACLVTDFSAQDICKLHRSGG